MHRYHGRTRLAADSPLRGPVASASARMTESIWRTRRYGDDEPCSAQGKRQHDGRVAARGGFTPPRPPS
jgi:hypothetical protein